jgi:pyruvate dehydrogenase E2 component (dihydrolipoamide acetyltransferase)
MAKSIIDIILPDLGEGISGAEVSEVSISVGDQLNKGDTIVVLESDKASMEIPSDLNGTVKEILVKTGQAIEVGHSLIKLETDNAQENKEKTKPRVDETGDKQEPLKQPSPQNTQSDVQLDPSSGDKTFSSPGVRRLARELSIDLSHIKGSGDKGRITKDDLHKHIKLQMASQRGVAQSINQEVDYKEWGSTEEIKLSKIKKITGRRLQEAWQTIPHVTQFDEADITKLDSTRRAMNKELEKKKIKITFLPFLIKAATHVLKSMPEFNSSLNHTGETLIMKHYYNIGIAVDTPRGLVVPVIKDVDSKTIVDLSIELMDISDRAKSNKLKPKELSGGTFTISSLGGIGGKFFTPIINPPEVAILGISKSIWENIYNHKTKSSSPKYIMPFSLSYDHRIIDGAAAAKFTSTFSHTIEELSFKEK